MVGQQHAAHMITHNCLNPALEESVPKYRRTHPIPAGRSPTAVRHHPGPVVFATWGHAAAITGQGADQLELHAVVRTADELEGEKELEPTAQAVMDLGLGTSAIVDAGSDERIGISGGPQIEIRPGAIRRGETRIGLESWALGLEARGNCHGRFRRCASAARSVANCPTRAAENTRAPPVTWMAGSCPARTS